MNELISIYRQNNTIQNLQWFGNIIVFFVTLPYFLVKEFFM